MGIECSKIKRHLEELELAVSELKAIAPIDPSELALYNIGKQALAIQLPSDTEAPDPPPLMIKTWQQDAGQLQTLVVELINGRLEKLAKEPGLELPVATSLTESAESSLEQSRKRIAFIAEQIHQVNQRYRKELTQLQKKLRQHEDNPLLPKVNTALKSLKSHPGILFPAKEMEEIRSQPLRRKKRTKNIVQIEDFTPVSNETSQSFENLRQLSEVIERLEYQNAELASNERLFQPELATDFLLTNWFEAYRQKNRESIHLIESAKKQITNKINLPDYHNILQNELSGIISRLQTLHSEREELTRIITQRQGLLSPSTEDIGTLATCLTESKRIFLTALETFLLTYSTIELDDKQNKTNQYFVEQIKLFVDQLIETLYNNPDIFAKEPITLLRKKIFEHLGEKCNWYNLRVITCSLDPKQIPENCSKLLHEEGSSVTDSATIKRHISAIYHIVAMIEDFPIQSIKNYDILKQTLVNQNNTIKKQHERINRTYESIDDEIKRIIQALQDQGNLLPSEFNNNDHVLRAEKIKRELETFHLKLNKNQQSYQQKIEELQNDKDSKDTVLSSDITNFKHDVDKINIKTEQLSDFIREQLLFMKKLDAFHNEITEFTEEIQSEEFKRNYIFFSVKERHSLKESLITAQSSLLMLRDIYSEKKRRLRTELTEALDDTKAALLFAEYSEKEIQDRLAPQRNFLQTIMTFEDNLFSLIHDTRKNITTANKHVTNVIDSHRETLDPLIRNMKRNTREFLPPAIRFENPFSDALSTTTLASEAAVLQLDSHFETLGHVTGKGLARWSTTFNQRLQNARDQIGKRNQAVENALEIERRLNMETYRTSLEIIGLLGEEFVRIINDHIDAAIANSILAHETQKLRTIKEDPRTLLSHHNLTELDNNLLQNIDPRLMKLLSIYTQFSAINSEYINENLFLLDDKRYQESLMSSVTVHLRNDHMEEISQGVRPDFIQWLRVKILKPLQKLHYTLANYVKPDAGYSPNFFKTWGACSTEAALVLSGEQFYTSLEMAASAA
ncbi:hypothetical protein [Legionella spiritensis]|uniref:Uncharacterized protein n=1 Tax=Legionella spiritensis TaxID=452 RepID=A0A0W0Z9P8_LEGSP|nr:hypothetical protein [Legionella spiritensis]KTD65646.1 hypothetical protein Lspi_0358 [Legionella spiritensis]SNV43775.1 Uncharacterised protein [Legionella spiritensis]